MTEVLTREEALKELKTPTGRQLTVAPRKQGTLFEIKFSDGKGGHLPDSMNGLFTSPTRAKAALMKYLEDFWNTSDSVKRKEKA